MACGIDQSEATTISRDSQSDSSVGGATYAQYLSRVSVRENDSCPVSAAMQNDPQLLLVSMETLLKQGPSMEELATASGSPRLATNVCVLCGVSCLPQTFKFEYINV